MGLEHAEEYANQPQVKYEVKMDALETVQETQKVDGFEEKCDQCQYTTKKPGQILKHMSNHNGMIVSQNGTEIEYNCQQCRFKTKTKSHLKVHITTKHTGIRFDCHNCSFQTAYRKDLARHKLAKHNVGIHPYQCDHCEYKARNKAELKKHILTKHSTMKQKEKIYES